MGQQGTGGTGFNSTQPNSEIGLGQYRWQTLEMLGDAGCGITVPPSRVTYCWGLNGNGELGDGTTTNRPSPVPVSGAHTFLSLGRYGGNELRHKCAIRNDSALLCWGENDFGQIGDGTLGTDQLVPKVIGLGYVHTAQADDATCAITTTGLAACWGKNTTGRIGDSTTTSHVSPALVKTTQRFSVIGLGATHTCALNFDGRAFCWGDNAFGQLGDNSNTNALLPVAVSGGHSFTDIRVGLGHTCGLRVDRMILCWGYNQDGQLGDGTTTHANVPRLVFTPLPP
jgi:alpha-tubulin suppressor-like RCC1 family protein